VDGWQSASSYDVKQRKLVVNQEEAGLVNNLYRWYLELGSVSKLKAYLDEQGVKSKERISAAGKHSGGVSFFPGALYLILQNPIYLEKVRHRNESYLGEHKSIISKDTWEQVQAKLKSDNQGRRNGIKANCSSILVEENKIDLEMSRSELPGCITSKNSVRFSRASRPKNPDLNPTNLPCCLRLFFALNSKCR
jgi:site-specific DNA recombinase